MKYRFCPGNHIALSNLWLTAASVLATFELSKALDKDGRIIQPSRKYDHWNGSVSQVTVS